MKKLLLASASCLLLAASCSKDDNNTVTPDPTPTPKSVNGYFYINYDTTMVKIDSMRSYYLNPNGILDSTTTFGQYSYKTPARRYDSGDSAYASVFAWGTIKNIMGATQEMKFSEDFIPSNSSQRQGTSRKDNKNGFTASYGFRLK